MMVSLYPVASTTPDSNSWTMARCKLELLYASLLLPLSFILFSCTARAKVARTAGGVEFAGA